MGKPTRRGTRRLHGLECFRAPITGVDRRSHLAELGPTQTSANEGKARYFVENVPVAFHVPGEWYPRRTSCRRRPVSPRAQRFLRSSDCWTRDSYVRGSPGPRGRTDYRATATGKRLLKDGWLALIEAGPSGDADSDLRVALLALSAGGGRRQAADFLRRAADRKMESIGAPEPIDDVSALAPLARWYSDLRSSAARMLLAAESSAIRAMAEALPQNLTGKPRHSIRGAKKHKGT